MLVRRLCQMFGFGGQALKSGAGRLLHCALAPMPRAKLLFHQGKGPGALSIPGPPTSVVAPERVSLGRTQPTKSPLGIRVPSAPMMVLRS